MLDFNKYGDLESDKNYGGSIYRLLEEGDVSYDFLDLSLSANSGITTNIDSDKLSFVYSEVFSPGNEIVPTGVVDNTNVSTNEANLINGNLTDLTYNNSSAGTVNKELPGIDLGASISVGVLRVHWWNEQYTASNYSIQGSNDGNSWVDVITGLNSTGLGNDFVDIIINDTYQYWRVFVLQGNNASWSVISEMKVYEVGASSYRSINSNEDIILEIQSGKARLINNSISPVNLKIYHNK